MAFSVARRTREIGLRMALGAQSTNVTWLMMREVLLLAAGTLLALPVAWALSRLVESQLLRDQATRFAHHARIGAVAGRGRGAGVIHAGSAGGPYRSHSSAQARIVLGN